MNAEKRFLDYADGYDRSNGKIELKIVHTLAVAEVMDRLTEALRLTERQRELAHICAVFHDIGRFEQVRRYDTFLDYLSRDHAALGCEVLEQGGFLEELSDEEQRQVLTAIRNHNRFQIEEGLDPETLLLCKLIRDADKSDIFRVFACEDMVDTMGETEEQVAKEQVTDVVYQSILEHRCVKKEERETGLDKWVTFLGFVFDFYFEESMVFLKETGYYRQPFDRVRFADPETRKRVERILEEVEGFLAAGTGLSGEKAHTAKAERIILASASPRRRELLAQAGFGFEIKVSDVCETVAEKEPARVVEELAARKAGAVAGTERDALVIGADTIVAVDGEILGKPHSREEAFAMLEKLQGRTHQVYTGVALLCGERRQVFSEKTDVTMYPMTEQEIEAYIHTGEPMDKAGAYGIQGRAAVYIERIEGDYNNVVGLPIAMVYQELKACHFEEKAGLQQKDS